MSFSAIVELFTFLQYDSDENFNYKKNIDFQVKKRKK